MYLTMFHYRELRKCVTTAFLNRHSRESGNPLAIDGEKWIPAVACPRMFESGAG